jgi:hypothetical protein
MVTHGEGPKDVFVNWQNGHFRRVNSSLRGSWHKTSLRPSPDQLDFGF